MEQSKSFKAFRHLETETRYFFGVYEDTLEPWQQDEDAGEIDRTIEEWMDALIIYGATKDYGAITEINDALCDLEDYVSEFWPDGYIWVYEWRRLIKDLGEAKNEEEVIDLFMNFGFEDE